MLRATDSQVWQTPDLQLGSHVFAYSNAQYDGLLHTHREYSIVNCVEGEIVIHLAGGDEVLSAGETFVVNPGLPHRCTFGLNGVPSKGTTLLVAPQVLSGLCVEMGFTLASQSSIPFFHQKLREADLLTSAQQIAAECSEMRKGFNLVVELLARQMLVHVLRAWPREFITENVLMIPQQLPWLYMHRATQYMNAYGKGEFRLFELCQEVGLSSSRFIPLFKNSAQMSPHTYYNHLLIFKAQRLLRDECCSTKETSYALGFKNVSHFCSLYHKLTGTAPREISRLPISIKCVEPEFGSSGRIRTYNPSVNS